MSARIKEQAEMNMQLQARDHIVLGFLMDAPTSRKPSPKRSKPSGVDQKGSHQMRRRRSVGREVAAENREKHARQIESLKVRIQAELRKAGKSGLINHQIADALNAHLDPNSPEWMRRATVGNIASALGALKAEGVVVETGEKRSNRNGNNAAVIVLAEFADELPDRQALQGARRLRKAVTVALQKFEPTDQIKLARHCIAYIHRKACHR